MLAGREAGGLLTLGMLAGTPAISTAHTYPGALSRPDGTFQLWGVKRDMHVEADPIASYPAADDAVTKGKEVVETGLEASAG